ncbi:hypothetical protein M3P05_05170 [Sansalvadorimonas sp. 2012CJ34-2]|uniref:Uncharacterized protein n=1 Tax=Parendozoicomonas callyspongiae TaxID=2942213 RepID=A0ABT0PDC1_9GAMM|nr:hypothetical protein [Sansalvadorimonas sp. 2012CJ34-2]MCL6269335.1 hypothetical protein [Sansalvadorimonas sp. 2012CJ34-2]
MAFEILPITKPYRPKVPDFDRVAKPIKFDISGTQLSLKLPVHKPDYSEELFPKPSYDIHDLSRYEKVGNYLSLSILARAWKLKGPLFHENAGELFFWCGVTFVEGCDLENSLFSHEVFEEAVLKCTRSEWGEGYGNFKNGCQINRAPVNWKIITLADFYALQFEIYRDFSQSRIIQTFIPLTHSHFLCFMLRDNTLFIQDKGDRHLIDQDPINHFFEKILDSISIDLSEVSKSQKQIIEDRFRNQKYSAHRLPEKWTTEEQDKEYEEHLRGWEEIVRLSQESVEAAKKFNSAR